MSSTVSDKSTKPDLLGLFKNLYVLHYRHAWSDPRTINFVHDGSFQDAIQRGKDHCRTMQYRFIAVRPFVVDLEEKEARRDDYETTLNG